MKTNLNRPEQIKFRYQQVIEKIGLAANKVGRDLKQINVVVVTKTHPVEVLSYALDAGIRKFGENYTDEAVDKINVIGKIPGLEWHMIGHIQSRKASLVCQNFQMVHSLDSLKLASRMDRFSAGENKLIPVLLECNSSGESTKNGWNIAQEDQWSTIAREFELIQELTNLKVQGLMTMAPFSDNPETARPYFRRLRRFQQYLQSELTESNWTELSMGMSGDFQVAVEEGSTYVRIGTAILGRRES